MKIAKISLLCIFLSCFTTMFADNLYDAIVIRLKTDLQTKNNPIDPSTLSVELLVFLDTMLETQSPKLNPQLSIGVLKMKLLEAINTKKPFLLTNEEIAKLKNEQLTEKKVENAYNKQQISSYSLVELQEIIKELNETVNTLIRAYPKIPAILKSL